MRTLLLLVIVVCLVALGFASRLTPAQTPGIEKRIPVTTSTVVGSPDPPLPFRKKRVYPNYSPAFPIMAKAVPGAGQLLVITEAGAYGTTALYRIKDHPDAKTADAVKLMDTPDKGVAYDFAFHPKFTENGYLYVGWNGPKKGKVKNKFCYITRYTWKDNAIDPASAKLIIEWESDGHNGAAVCFGLDGMLYVTSGDGTSDSDGDVMGQRTDTLLAKILRIDVDHPADGKAYSVPKDNPFVPETWAYGMRQPWRITCDEKTGHIWLGQNGQDLWEFAHLVRKGDNYGWSVTEGSHPFYPTRTAGPTPIVKPTIEHHHSEARSLTGGVVYHGEALPELRGAYVYGDYSTGRIWAMKHDGAKPLWHRELTSSRLAITGFGTNSKGELLICDHRGGGEGALYTLEPNPEVSKASTFPKKLSESGLFDSVKGHRMKPGVIPYSVNAPFWSDGMHKERWLSLPGTETITHTRTRGWNFPDLTVLVKSFATEPGKWVETRFLTKQGGEWYGYSYVWNSDGTDAELIPANGLDKEVTIGGRKQVWHYPSRAECMVCHSRAQNFVLGLCEQQMNKGDQFRTFERLGLMKVDWAAELKARLRDEAKDKGLKDKAIEQYVAEQTPKLDGAAIPERMAKQFPRLVDPYDAKQDRAARAKSWLHVNCSSCHVEAGGGNAAMELEFATALDKMRIHDVKPLHATLDLPEARLVAPGHPDRSVLLKRAGTRGTHQMPPLSTNRPDEEGLKLLREWIASLK